MQIWSIRWKMLRIIAQWFKLIACCITAIAANGCTANDADAAANDICVTCWPIVTPIIDRYWINSRHSGLSLTCCCIQFLWVWGNLSSVLMYVYDSCIKSLNLSDTKWEHSNATDFTKLSTFNHRWSIEINKAAWFVCQ